MTLLEKKQEKKLLKENGVSLPFFLAHFSSMLSQQLFLVTPLWI